MPDITLCQHILHLLIYTLHHVGLVLYGNTTYLHKSFRFLLRNIHICDLEPIINRLMK